MFGDVSAVSGQRCALMLNPLFNHERECSVILPLDYEATLLLQDPGQFMCRGSEHALQWSRSSHSITIHLRLAISLRNPATLNIDRVAIKHRRSLCRRDNMQSPCVDRMACKIVRRFEPEERERLSECGDIGFGRRLTVVPGTQHPQREVKAIPVTRHVLELSFHSAISVVNSDAALDLRVLRSNM
jgi:hypothetical protein